MNRSLLFIEELEKEEHRVILTALHDLIQSLLPQIRPVFKWNCPFFDYFGKYFCYMYVSKNQAILSFVNCGELGIPINFRAERKKVVTRIFISDVKMIQTEDFMHMILEAAAIHEAKNKKV